ncbi:MAG: RNA-guided pseudouridylation complex pseudouridine synthase subunit Cbf5, partial [Candidatus Thermoplasmatota archaeon]|nr:RNA-guided pseudouridylation complex pseudouridine synthase subunit Cbf5 [Candidatus Thermoplasmatota archaeon]
MTHLVLDAEATTDPAFGQRPEERSIEQRIAAGVLLLDKPAGPT